MTRRFSPALLAAWLVLGTPSAQASSQPRIAIVISDDALAQEGLLARARLRLRSELRAAGFEVVEVTTKEGSARDMVERSARRADAVAAARLLRAEGTTSADVWISDQLTEKTVVRRIPMMADDPQAPATMALRVVELLKASLVEVELDLQTQSQSEAPPEVDRLVDHTQASGSTMPWSISVGLTTLWSPGQLPSVGSRVGLAYRLSNGLAVGLHFSGPLWGAELETSGGNVSRLEMALSGTLRLYREVGASRWFWVPGVAIGAYTIGVEGNGAEPGFVARSERAWSAMGMLSLGIVRELGSRFEIGLETFVGVLVPQVSIYVGNAREGRFGAPLLGGTLSFGTAF